MTPRHLLADDDLSPAEQAQVLDLAARLKADRFVERPLEGPRGVALIFDKPTLRTQLSFTAGVAELGGAPVLVDGRLAGIGEREPIVDTACVLGRQVSAIVWRTHGQGRIEEMARWAGVPVVNALTDDYHPCQLLADLLTVREAFGDVAGRTLVYLGDGANNMAHSYLLACATAGMDVRIVSPASHRPDPGVLARARDRAAETGGACTVTDDLAAVDGADVVVTDTWVSMGQESQAGERKGEASPFVPFRVTADVMARAAAGAIFLRCLPA